MTTTSEKTAAGGARDDFSAWWQADGEWVEAPNRRRGGESGVMRVENEAGRVFYVKRQVGHLHRSLRHPLGRPTVLREREALLAFARLGVGVPGLAFAAARRGSEGWCALLVTEALEGMLDLDSWYAGPRHGQTRVMQALGVALARLHRGRWQHGCLYAKHVFLRQEENGQVEVAFLDLEKSRRRLSRRQAAQHDLRQLRRHSPLSEDDWRLLGQGYMAESGEPVEALLG